MTGRILAVAAAAAALAVLVGVVLTTTGETGPCQWPDPEAALWAADMAEGDLADWYAAGPSGEAGGGEFNSGSADAVVSQERALSERHAAKLMLSGSGGTRLFRWQESRTTRDATYSVCLFIPRQVRVDGWWNVIQVKSRSTSGANDPIWILEPRTDDGGRLYPTLVWWHRSLEGPRPGESGFRRISPPDGTSLPIARWFELELRLLQSSDFDGRVTVTIDGAQVWDLDGVRTGYRNCAYNDWCTDNDWSVNNYGEELSPWPSIFADDAAIHES